MGSADNAMKELNQQWYNALTNGLSLDPGKFQLTQGSLSVGYDSEKLWNILDSIPPDSIDHYFDPVGYNSFAQTYSAVINNLIPQTDEDLRQLLADDYPDWDTYNRDRANNPASPPRTASGELDYAKIAVLKFQNWAISAIDKSRIDKGVTLLKQQDVVTVALNMLLTADHKYAYTATQQFLLDSLAKGQSKTIHMDSSTTNSDVSKSWANGKVSGKYKLFSGGIDAHWDKLASDISSQHTVVNATFKKVCTLPGKPFMTKSGVSSDLSKFDPWFCTPALKSAKNNNNNNLWKRVAPTWEDTFGPEGNLTRMISSLIIVDGIDITLTSTAKVESTNHDAFKTSVNAGFWPFFKASGNGGWSNDVNFKDDGTFTVTSSSKEGNPTVIGVLVDPIDAIL